MKISRFTKNFLNNTKVREGDFDWHLYDMGEELTDEQLDGLIQSIATGNNTYTFESFKADVEEAIEGVYEVSDE
jgi:hypothetical protein